MRFSIQGTAGPQSAAMFSFNVTLPNVSARRAQEISVRLLRDLQCADDDAAAKTADAAQAINPPTYSVILESVLAGAIMPCIKILCDHSKMSLRDAKNAVDGGGIIVSGWHEDAALRLCNALRVYGVASCEKDAA
jgi:hypothetical protein